jgi:hypothetical protein
MGSASSRNGREALGVVSVASPVACRPFCAGDRADCNAYSDDEEVRCTRRPACEAHNSGDEQANQELPHALHRRSLAGSHSRRKARSVLWDESAVRSSVINGAPIAIS